MDDFIIFTKTRWHLRKAVKKLNQFFNQFSFKQHPDKTFIGKIDKGFDWMGFQITLQGIVDIAPRSMEKLILKLAQLYEQNQPLTPIVRALNYFYFVLTRFADPSAHFASAFRVTDPYPRPLDTHIVLAAQSPS